MAAPFIFPPQAELPLLVAEMILEASANIVGHTHKAFHVWGHRGRGRTLRPGKDTPLWNQLRAQLRPQLRKYGQQANLGRVLGLPRQRIQAFVTAGTEMPDAERTLQLLAWLCAVHRGWRPA